ncbi:hypothetical protein ACRYCC_26005 [Actinomadura scrupuli]|uniref:hypothetical protein n=1 Tax=Actinomadura scrupuli TaxID=559629 RepID=UPI003D99B9A7
MSDDTRRHYDRTASDWWTACEAISAAAGPAVTIPTLQLATILHGYRQLQAERDAVLKVIDDWNRSALVDRLAVLRAWHALGVISDEEWGGHLRAAPPAQPADRPGRVAVGAACLHCGTQISRDGATDPWHHQATGKRECDLFDPNDPGRTACAMPAPHYSSECRASGHVGDTHHTCRGCDCGCHYLPGSGSGSVQLGDPVQTQGVPQ